MVDQDLDWMAQGPIYLLNNLHKMPRHPKNLLSKFYPDKKTKVEDHIDDLYMHLWILKVQYNDVACRIFPFPLEGRGAAWYHSIPVNSIHSWRKIKNLFLEKFVDDKTPTMLLKELRNIKMGKRIK